MRFAPMKEILELAEERKIAYGAFVTVSYETALAAIEAGSELDCPVIFITGTDCCDLMGGFEGTVETVKRAAANATVPIALHLDHCRTYEECVQAIQAGYSSVMIDGSSLPFEENIEEVKRAVEYCHFYNVPVEAELGCLQGKEEDIVNEADAKTDPDMVADFVSQTGCDLLAVAVGNVHGLDIEPKVDLPLLEQISKISPVPLVMHGGSGIPFDIIQKAREFNLLKVNYGSDLRKAFVSTFGQAYEANHNACSVIELSIEAVENVSEKAAELVTIINS